MSANETDIPTLLDRLLSLEEIKQLKAKYCRFLDTKQWARLAALFSEDASFEGFGSAPNGATVSMFIQGVSSRMAMSTSVHHCHTPEIVFDSSDRARGIWAMEDYVQWPPGAPVVEAKDSCGFKGFGHYEERYVRVNGRWLFAFLRLTRLRIDALPATHPAPRPGFMKATGDWI